MLQRYGCSAALQRAVGGSIERAPVGQHGWLARDPHRSIQPHQGDTRRYARTRQHAVVDLLLGLGYSSAEQ